MSDTACKDYLKDRQKFWESEGFERIGAQVEDAPVFRRRRFSLTKFGIVDTFIVPTCVDTELTTAHIAGFSSQAFNVGLQHKSFFATRLRRDGGGLPAVFCGAVQQ